jgi:putative endonuclease
MDLVRSIACRLNRLRKPSSTSTPDPRHLFGQAGENAAAAHLKRNGYKVLYRNFRARHGGEVDIVCRERATNTLVFIEVKTRESREWGDPHAAVDLKKQRLIIRGAMEWMRMLEFPEIKIRFDIVEVVGSEGNWDFNIIKDAFHLPNNYHL